MDVGVQGLKTEAELLFLMRSWCDADPVNRKVKLYMIGELKDIRCELIDAKVASHGYGHCYAGVGHGTTLSEAVEEALLFAERWSKNHERR